MRALTPDFIVGEAIERIHHRVAARIAAASKNGVAPADVALILPPPHTGADLSFRCFELAKAWRMNPAQIAGQMAEELNNEVEADDLVARWIAAGPYLNVELERDATSALVLAEVDTAGESYGCSPKLADEVVMVEYVSPNTNKPLHLGHIRNAILGRAVARLLEAQGARVYRTDIINDRGIHIAKSVIAYERFADGATPATSGVKGDHFVGRLYVRFEQELQSEKKSWLEAQSVADPKTLPEDRQKALEDRFNQESELLTAAREWLLKWEAGDPEVRRLWQRMNDWVYAGFEETYEKLGIHFDKHYYESEIYQGGKEIIHQALDDGLFERAANGAVIAPLAKHGKLQDKAVLRADGTGLYITQDINLATIKFEEFGLTRSLYCIASEQDFYMKQLIATLRLLGFPWADGLHHLSYGMVYLPEGKMKSREGKVVDADDLMAGMAEMASEALQERWPELAGEELERRAHAIGLSAMVFHFLAVGRDTEIHFDPKSSLAFEGKTGPYLQYAYARVASILRKAGEWTRPEQPHFAEDVEWRILFQVALYPAVVADAAESLDPMRLTSYLVELAQSVNSFYHDHPVLQSDEPVRSNRLALLEAFRRVLGSGLGLLTIEALEEM